MTNFTFFSYYWTFFRSACLIGLVIIPMLLRAQTDSTTTLLQLKTVEVSALKIKKPWLRAATSIYQLTPSFKDQIPQNSLQEFLADSPGIFALNANNQVQDLRISIRGFGSRAAFGVRGVKIIVDGIPETTADGQGQLDNLNLPIIENIEVLPGGASALYGNASGGVINISTTDETAFLNKDFFNELHIGLQAYGGKQFQYTLGKKINKTSLIFHVDSQFGKGYRAHAKFRSTKYNLRIIKEISKDSKLELLANYMDSPEALDPGGVNLMTFDETPRAARDRNVEFRAGEAIKQFKGSVRYQTKVGKKLNFNTYAFYSNRDFLGRLPFTSGGIIDLNRHFFGIGSNLNGKKTINATDWKWQLGYELLAQRDQRFRFDNEIAFGALTLNQKEQFNNAGIFLANDFSWKNWILNTSIRYDLNRVKAIDDFLDNGDDSGQLDLNNFNYSLGLAYSINSSMVIFGNASTSFETPTLNELSNNPDGSGFNASLQAQAATHFEFGIKGLPNNNARYQLSFFLINSEDELLPYELEAFPGRSFFRNIGSTQRRGIELLFQQKINNLLSASTNWSWQDFTFKDYVLDGANLKGNQLPGLPNFQGNIRLTFDLPKGFHLHLQQQFWGRIYTNDENDEFQKAKAVTNLSLKYKIKGSRLLPYLGVNNIFREKYADNIRINAFGGRYYEAAPRAYLYGGLRVKF